MGSWSLGARWLLAETVQFDPPGWLVALVLAVILLIVVAIIGFVVAGFKAAERAGRGSAEALAVWIVIALIEGSIGLYSLFQRSYWVFWVVPLGLVGMQAFTYLDTKKNNT